MSERTAADVIAKSLMGDLSAYHDGSEPVLAALRAAGYAVVKLPEPQEREDEHEVITRWDDPLSFTVVVWDDHPDEVGIAYDFEPFEPLSPADARTLAAALLAAADCAEGVGGV